MSVPGESSAQSAELTLAQAGDQFGALMLAEVYDPLSIETAFSDLATALSNEDTISPAERLATLSDAAHKVHELAAYAGDDERAGSFGGRADGYDSALEMLRPNLTPVEQLKTGLLALNEFIAGLGLVCKGYPVNQFLSPPKGSRIQIVPLEGTALPVDKYAGYKLGTFLSFHNFVPREVGEPLEVSFFWAFFTESGLQIDAVCRHASSNTDETLPITGLDIPFDIVKTEEILIVE